MCKVDWAAVGSVTAGLAAICNLGLLVWLIRVTVRYVTANEGLLDVTRGSLAELRRQNARALEREKRPMRNVIHRAVQGLEDFRSRDLAATFGTRDPTGWPTARELIPEDFSELLESSKNYDVDLYDKLRMVSSNALERARERMEDMDQVGRSGRAAIAPDLERLQSEFRAALDQAVTELKLSQELLEKVTG